MRRPPRPRGPQGLAVPAAQLEDRSQRLGLGTGHAVRADGVRVCLSRQKQDTNGAVADAVREYVVGARCNHPEEKGRTVQHAIATLELNRASDPIVYSEMDEQIQKRTHTKYLIPRSEDASRKRHVARVIPGSQAWTSFDRVRP